VLDLFYFLKRVSLSNLNFSVIVLCLRYVLGPRYVALLGFGTVSVDSVDNGW
jgi:hypothetical protein